MARVFANGQEDHCSIPGQVIPKIQETVCDPAFLNTQHEQNKGKLECPFLHLCVVAIETGTFRSLSTVLTSLTFLYGFNYS